MTRGKVALTAASFIFGILAFSSFPGCGTGLRGECDCGGRSGDLSGDYLVASAQYRAFAGDASTPPAPVDGASMEISGSTGLISYERDGVAVEVEYTVAIGP